MKPQSDALNRRQLHQAIVLAMVAGYIDSFTLLNLQVYTSFMSGNTTQGGLHAGQGEFSDAGYRLLPIPLFVLGVALGTHLLEGPRRWRARHLWGTVAALLATSAGAIWLGPLGRWCDLVILSFSMGMMNTSVTHVGGQSVSLGFVTGDLNNLGRHLAMAAGGVPLSDADSPEDSRWRRVGTLGSVWGAFLCGAAISGLAMLFIGKWVLLPPIGILAYLAIAGRNPDSRALSNHRD